MLKNNKVRKILSIVLIAVAVISLVLSMSTIVNADPFDPISATDSSAIGKIQGWGGIILGVFQAVGMSIAVIILVWLGIKYIMASPDGKAEIKKQAFAYILGAVLLFGATAIITVVKNVVTENSSDASIYTQTIEDVQRS